MRHSLISLVFLFAPLVAEAQDAMQQCIWGCLAGRSASDPAYHACVSQTCNQGASSSVANPGAGADPTRVWQSGRSGTGGNFAGIDLPGFAGELGVYFFCSPGGPQQIMLVGAEGPPVADLGFVVDGQVFPMRFVQGEGWPTASPARGLLGAMQKGSRLDILREDASVMWSVPLAGSKAALATTLSGC
jgi:hypothetical protein